MHNNRFLNIKLKKNLILEFYLYILYKKFQIINLNSIEFLYYKYFFLINHKSYIILNFQMT